ncbi:hypothetical protein D3C76_1404280 [compost metagenome]
MSTVDLKFHAVLIVPNCIHIMIRYREPTVEVNLHFFHLYGLPYLGMVYLGLLIVMNTVNVIENLICCKSTKLFRKLIRHQLRCTLSLNM